jgi:hypothetical protein
VIDFLVRQTERLLRPDLARLRSGARRLEVIYPDDTADRLRIEKNNPLIRYAKSVTSQVGEDGVIAHILERLGITSGWCVEFGAWDGKYNANTWDLVHNRGWKAVYIEANEGAFAMLLENSSALSDVYCINEFIEIDGPKSLDALLSRTPIPKDFDFLVIDIDSNDWHIWKSLQGYRPKVVMIEFSEFCPPEIFYVKDPHAPGPSSASLSAVCELGKQKGYELIAVVGGNAIFVLDEYSSRFEIRDNSPQGMFKSFANTRLFQSYDGTLFLAGNRELIWRHQRDRDGLIKRIHVSDADIQVLPEGLRIFQPRLSYKNAFLEENAGRLDRSRVPSNRLLDFQINVTSECGEDGILAHIFEKIGEGNKYCVEVGAHDGVRFSNTFSLIRDRNWSALLIESDASAYQGLQSIYSASDRVRTMNVKVDATGRNSLGRLLGSVSAPTEIDFLCIDVEGNDYHLWANLRGYRPRVVMIDFNPTIPNDVLFVQEDSDLKNDGASLSALIELGRALGYELAAATTWNAIFVRRELLGKLGIENNNIDSMYYPVFEMRVFWSINCYLHISGCDRLVRHNYVFNPEQIQPIPANVRTIPYAKGLGGTPRSTFFD